MTVGTASFPALPITGAASATVAGPLVVGGLGNAPVAEWSGKIVLLDRGTLVYEEKLKAVQVAGGLGVIIANNATGPAHAARLITPPTSPLVAVTVTQADGAALKLKAGETVSVGIAGQPAPIPGAPGPPGPIGPAGPMGPPGVTINPAATMTSEVNAGKSVSFTVDASGTAPFTFQWIKDGANITGATTAVLAIASATVADSGTYICQTSNAAGTSASGAHILSVKTSP